MKTAKVFLCFLVLCASGSRIQAENVSFIVLGDIHYDRLDFHDLEWIKTKWVNQDDYRQITEEYTVYTRQYWDDLMKLLGHHIKGFNPPIKGIVQLGDLMEGLAGSPELAKKMAQGTIEALEAPDFPVPWILVKGNHDGWYGPGDVEAYNEIMLPFIRKELNLNITKPSFTYTVGNVQFFCPDYEDAENLIPFLDKELSASRAKYKFVALHVPVVPVTGRCWDVYNFRNPKHEPDAHERLLELLTRHKAIVLCDHLHKYSIVRRMTSAGPVVQVMLNSVIRQKDADGPYWYTTEYGPSLIDREPHFSPDTRDKRAGTLAEEAKYVTDFRLADLPGYGIISVYDKKDKVVLRVYKGLDDKAHEEVDLTALLQGGPVQSSKAEQGKEDSFKFAWITDTHFGKDTYQQERLYPALWLQQALEEINDIGVDFIFHGGDLIESAGNTEQFDLFDAVMKPAVPWYPIAGNHDIGSKADARQDKIDLWLERGYGRGSYNREYYGFVHKSAAFFVLNTLAQTSSDPLVRWRFEDQLYEMDTFFAANSNVPVKVVCGHVPLFVDSSDEADAYFNIEKPYREKIITLMEKHGVHNYLAGHCHIDKVATKGDMTVYINTSLSFQLGTGNRRGFYIFSVAQDELRREFHALKEIAVADKAGAIGD
jgi:predicted MPP superfamily phosphohydrolase